METIQTLFVLQFEKYLPNPNEAKSDPQVSLNFDVTSVTKNSICFRTTTL